MLQKSRSEAYGVPNIENLSPMSRAGSSESLQNLKIVMKPEKLNSLSQQRLDKKTKQL